MFSPTCRVGHCPLLSLHSALLEETPPFHPQCFSRDVGIPRLTWDLRVPLEVWKSMNKILIGAIVLMMAASTAPAASAETVTETYTGGLGFFVAGAGLALYCDDSCVGDDQGLGDMPNLGGATLTAPSGNSYGNLVVSINDEGFWGSNGGISACFYNPAGDNVCNEDDYGSDWTCGSVPLLNSPFPGSEASVWALTILANEALDVCGATFGTISGDLF